MVGSILTRDGQTAGIATKTYDPASGVTDTDAIHDNVPGEISAITEKPSPVDADLFVIEDSAASNAKKRVQIQHVPGAVVSGSTPSAVIGKLWYDTAASSSALAGVVSIKTVTTNYTALQADEVILVNATSGAVTITLPAVADRTGKPFNIKKIDSSGNAVTIDGNGSETIDDTTTRVLSSQYDSVTIVSDGTEWWII